MPTPKMTAEITVVQISLRPIRVATGAPGSVPGAPLAVLVLAAHAERQRQEQHDPPQHEVDRERG